jgi:HAD superfamily hydrolase (TIGR01450 family)
MGSLADRFGGFIVDLDGVVHLGWRPIPGAIETLAELARRGKVCVFLTNDPRFSRAHIAARLREFGLITEPGRIVSSGSAAAEHLSATATGPVFVIGSAELKEEVRVTGSELVPIDRAELAERVLVGGHEGFCYAELRAAVQAVSRGAELVATNRDATFPMPDGPWPATGAILAAVEHATGKSAHVVGKPQPDIFHTARRFAGVTGPVCVIGDRLDTDILGGHRAGLATILVLTGSSEAEHVATAPAPPDHVIPRLADLLV